MVILARHSKGSSNVTGTPDFAYIATATCLDLGISSTSVRITGCEGLGLPSINIPALKGDAEKRMKEQTYDKGLFRAENNFQDTGIYTGLIEERLRYSRYSVLVSLGLDTLTGNWDWFVPWTETQDPQTILVIAFFHGVKGGIPSGVQGFCTSSCKNG